MYIGIDRALRCCGGAESFGGVGARYSGNSVLAVVRWKYIIFGPELGAFIGCCYWYISRTALFVVCAIGFCTMPGGVYLAGRARKSSELEFELIFNAGA